MIDKFSEKLLASPEKIDKPLKVVEAYIRQNRNQPSDSKRRRGRRYRNSRSGLTARQRVILYRSSMRNGNRVAPSSMSIDFDLDDAIERRMNWRKLRTLIKKNKGTGKRILSIESSNYEDKSFAYYRRNVMRDSKETFIDDPLRGRSAKYFRSFGTKLITPDITSKFYARGTQRRMKGGEVFVHGTSPYAFMFSEAANVPTDSEYGETSEWILLQPNKRIFTRRRGRRGRRRSFFSSAQWQAFMDGGTFARKTYEPTIVEDVTFSDHFHEKITPIYENEVEGEQSSPKKNFITSKSVYNYYNEKYEDFLSETDVPLNALPNLYNFLSEVVSDSTTEDVRDQNTLGGLIEEKNPFLKTPRGMSKSAVKESTLQKYLSKFGLKYKDAEKEGRIQEIVSKGANVIFPLLQTKEMLQADYKKEFFPMYNELEFTIDPDSEFVDILQVAKLEDEFTKNLIQKILLKQSDSLSFVENVSQPDGERKIEQVQKRVWDLTKDLFSQDTVDEDLYDKNITILGDDTSENNLSQNSNMFFFNNIVNLAFYAKLQEYIRKHFRTYEEMINGEKAHSEIVVYRIAKYVGPTTGEPIKNYFFLNKSDLETFRFADTQVRVNEEYTYEVYSYNLVVGNSYTYKEKSIGKDYAAVRVNQTPSLKIIENKIATTSNLILSDPPAIPDINVYPFFDKEDKIGFNFNGSVGNRLMTPIIFSENEKERVEKLKKSQNRTGREKIRFSQDGINRFYEVYRTTVPPTSPKDFVENMRIRTTKTSFIDTIEPNTTYYYLFRSIDNHGNVSNPSEVISVTMVKDKFVYPVIRNYSYENTKKKEKETRKKVKRFLRISPTLSSLLIDRSRTDVTAQSANKVVNAVMGPSGTSLWNKKFKIRVTSANSGKKMDLNFKFVQEYDKPTDEVI